MSDNQNISSKRIENYSLWEFLLAFQQAVQQGYVLDLVSNENFPQQIGVIFTAGVVKQEEPEEQEEVKKPIGRPKKVG